jgi:hypothetical protein
MLVAKYNRIRTMLLLSICLGFIGKKLPHAGERFAEF